jgi:hypothetical protein
MKKMLPFQATNLEIIIGSKKARLDIPFLSSTFLLNHEYIYSIVNILNCDWFVHLWHMLNISVWDKNWKRN